MNCYHEAIKTIGLSNQSQGPAGWAYLLLHAMAEAEAANPQASTYADPLREVLFRLDTGDRTNCFGVQGLRRIIGARV